jgi:hypothetical protein
MNKTARSSHVRKIFGAFAGVVIAGYPCGGAVVAEAENAADRGVTSLVSEMRASIEQCKHALAAAELDSIREKADPSRTAADGSPPTAIASNDTFPTGSERKVISKWITIRDLCLNPFDALLVVPPSATAVEATSLGQVFTLTRASESNVGDLIQALYEQKLTYGEFAIKRYEFTRDAAALNAAINEVGLKERNGSGLVETEQQLSHTIADWKTFVAAVKARRPRSVHVVGGEGAANR